MANEKTTERVLAFDHSWRNGIASYDETRLRGILASELRFEGPLAGKRNNLAAFVAGLAGFVKTLKSLRILQELHAGNEACVR
jgi:hypothetical protein